MIVPNLVAFGHSLGGPCKILEKINKLGEKKYSPKWTLCVQWHPSTLHVGVGMVPHTCEFECKNSCLLV